MNIDTANSELDSWIDRYLKPVPDRDLWDLLDMYGPKGIPELLDSLANEYAEKMISPDEYSQAVDVFLLYSFRAAERQYREDCKLALRTGTAPLMIRAISASCMRNVDDRLENLSEHMSITESIQYILSIVDELAKAAGYREELSLQSTPIKSRQDPVNQVLQAIQELGANAVKATRLTEH